MFLILYSQIFNIWGVLLDKKIDRSLLIQLIVLSVPATGFTYVLLSQALGIEGVYAGMGFVIAMLSFCTFVLYLADWQQSLKLEKILVVCLAIYFLLNLIAYSNYFALYLLNIVLSIFFLKNLKEQELENIKSFLGRVHFRFRQKNRARVTFYVGATSVIFLFFGVDLFYESTTDFLQSLFTMFFVLWLYGSLWIFFFRPCLNERYLVYIKIIFILGLSLSIISIWFDFLSITIALFDLDISAMAILYNLIVLLLSILFLMAFGTIKIIRKIF